MAQSGPWRRHKCSVYWSLKMYRVSFRLEAFSTEPAGQLHGLRNIPLQEQIASFPQSWLHRLLPYLRSEPLQDPNDRVRAFLLFVSLEKSPPCKMVTLPLPTHTPSLTVQSMPVTISSLISSLVFVARRKGRYHILINPPNPAASDILALVRFWAKVNDLTLLLSVFFQEVIHTY